MQPGRGARIAACLLLVSAALPAYPAPADRPCEGATIRVEASNDGDLAAACAAAATASSFFDRVGWPMPEALRVRLVSVGESHPLGESEIGRYDARRHEVVMRDYRNFRTVPEPATDGAAPHPVFASVAFWQSWLVHELTHAAIEAECGRRCLSPGQHECVAAVVQLATLGEAVRAQVLAEYAEVEAFDELAEVSATYYAINPRYFIVKCYKHFRAQPDPLGFLRALVSAQPRR